MEAASEPQPTDPPNRQGDLSNLDEFTIPEIPNRPQGERISVNGIDLYYEVFGEGRPVLLLHGGAATIESWFAQIPALVPKFQLIVPDSRGHGRSQDGGGPIDFQLMAADVAALLDHLGLSQVAIVGWSDGGVIGFELALRRPELVGKLITFGVHSRPDGMTEEFKLGIEAATPESFPAILAEGYKALSPDGPAHWPIVFEKLKSMWLTLPNFSERELQTIACPVLLVTGTYDIVRHEESERLARLLPNARLRVIDGASHYSPVEVPEIVNELIIGFIEES